MDEGVPSFLERAHHHRQAPSPQPSPSRERGLWKVLMIKMGSMSVIWGIIDPDKVRGEIAHYQLSRKERDHALLQKQLQSSNLNFSLKTLPIHLL